MEVNKIYIVLTQTYSLISRMIKSVTHDKYSHVSLSFDTKCNKMYSFSRKYRYFAPYGIFKKENIRKGLFKNKNSLIAIYELEVSKEKYDNIKRVVDDIKKNNKGYNIIGLLLAKFNIKLHRNKYYCSEFVYEVLSHESVNILDRNEVAFTPEELVKKRVFKKIYEGKIKDYITNH